MIKRRYIMMKSGSWVRVPTQLLRDSSLTGSDVLVFAVIADHDGGTGEGCKLSRARIAEESGLSVSTIKRAIAKLSAGHYIAAERSSGSETRYRQLVLAAKRRGTSKRPERAEEQNDLAKYLEFVNVFPSSDGEEVAG